MESPHNSKYPYTEFHKAYGFDPGKHRIKTRVGEPSLFEGHRLIIELDSNLNPVVHWFWFDEGWLKITYDKLLDPLNLRLRREFNEELAKCRSENKKFSDKNLERHRRLKTTKKKEKRNFVKIFNNKSMLHYKKLFHEGHKIEDLKGDDGFFCHTCKGGIKRAQPVKPRRYFEELNSHAV